MSKGLLCGDVCLIVSSYLPADLMLHYLVFYAGVCLEYAKTLTERMCSERVRAALPPFIRNNKEFLAWLGPDARLAGGFVLKCILGEEWENNDIDVFATRDKMETRPEWGCGGKDYICSSSTNYFAWADAAVLAQEYELKGLVAITDEYVTDTRNKKSFTHVQFIANEKPSVRDLIREFDFEFCSVSWDGALRIDFPEALMHRRSAHKRISRAIARSEVLSTFGHGQGGLTPNVHVRCLKYSSRGFTITNYRQPDRFIVPMCCMGQTGECGIGKIRAIEALGGTVQLWHRGPLRLTRINNDECAQCDGVCRKTVGSLGAWTCCDEAALQKIPPLGGIVSGESH
jgi:hypothetical protein